MEKRYPSELLRGTVHRSIHLLATALEALGAKVDLMTVERLAVMINEAMSASARSFHTPEHVFDLVDPENPRTTLAALFHDLVYYNVDQVFTAEVAEAVGKDIGTRDAEVWLRAGSGGPDPALRTCLTVFGLQEGQKLSPTEGMNEFLSALVMHRKLEGIVKPEDLLFVTACIEATIPFRKPDAAGVTPAERLADRLSTAAGRAGLSFPEDRIREAVRDAVSFANRDVANFAEEEVARFLDNTWKLLPESNPSLRTQGIYTIGSYRVALQKMEGFLQSLDPRTIFASYRGVPPEKELREMQQRAQRNVTIARDYLGIKLLGTGVLEALADISGGDAPISLFMGDVHAQVVGNRLQDFLPSGPAEPTITLDAELQGLLTNGRASASNFDLRNSPLASFLYLRLGTSRFHELLGVARRMFSGEISALQFLDAFPGDLIAAVAEGCAKMAFTRAERLLEYAAKRRQAS